MHVAVDLRLLDRDGMEHSGIGRYAVEATRALRAARPSWSLSLHSNRPDLFGESPGTSVHRTSWPTGVAGGRVAWLHLMAASATPTVPDVWWSPTFTLPRGWRGPAVVTVHDLVFRLRPQLYRSRIRALYASRATRVAAGRAEQVLCPSATTADRLVREFGIDREKVAVVPWGIGDVFRGAAAGPDDGYVLFVGRWEARKGLGLLHGAIRELAAGGRRLQLVVAGGPGWGAAAEIRALRADPAVELIEEPSDERLASLYARAMVLVYPSTMEGFGFPVAEAMAGGCPVVASDLPELRELAGDAATYVEPGDRRALAAALAALADDLERRRTMAARGREQAERFSWSDCGELTAGALEEAAARGSVARRS
ncbi:MAG: glycosyltransferase family 4 protein [Solirubrobacterales bacterium]